MRKIRLDRKTGFQILDPFTPVNIRDSKGRMFYTTESLVPSVKSFNLPSNIPLFIESGKFKSLPRPVKHKLKRLPPRERFGKANPSRFKVKYTDNPMKCSIDWRNKRIIFDKSMLENTIPDLTFILYHEFGHQFYGSEHLADLYARNCMIKRGYNPSQILLAPYRTLSRANDYRKDLIAKSVTT